MRAKGQSLFFTFYWLVIWGGLFTYITEASSSSKPTPIAAVGPPNTAAVIFSPQANAPTGITAMTVYNNTLCAIGSHMQTNNAPSGQLQQYNGSAWTTLLSSSSDSSFTSLCAYNNQLYATGTVLDALTNNQFTSFVDSIAVQNVKVPVQLSNLLSYSGYMYAVFSCAGKSPNTRQYGVAKYDGSNWVNFGLSSTVLSDSASINTLCIYNGTLYAGGQYLYYYNGTSWEVVTAVTGNVNSLAVYNGYLYIGGTGGGFATASNVGIWDGNTLLYLSNPTVNGSLFSCQYLAAANGYLYCFYSGTGSNTKPQVAISRWNGSNSSPCYVATSTSYLQICGSTFNGSLYVSVKNANNAFTTAIVQ